MPDQYDASKKSPVNAMIDPDFTQAQLDYIYARTVDSFWCPVCGMGMCRVTDKTMYLPYDQHEYTCDKCGASGTRNEIKAALQCPVCDRALDEIGMCPSGHTAPIESMNSEHVLHGQA